LSNNFSPFIVKYPKFEYTRLLDHNQKFHDSISIFDAQKMAKFAQMDLVCFKMPQNNEHAFCKIIDYGKWEYHNKKEKKKQLKSSKIETKEIRLSPNISENDIAHKIKQAIEFLNEGDYVIFTMKMTGRQRQFKDLAMETLNGILKMCGEYKEISRSSTNNSIIVKISRS